MNSNADGDLSGRLRHLADTAGSVSALARISDIPQRTMAGYVSGAHEPRASELLKIANAAKVSVNWLVTGLPDEGKVAKRDETPQSSVIQINGGHFDQKLMQECIVATIELLEAFEKTLPPKKLAEFAILLYAAEMEDRQKEGHHLSAANVVQLFRKFS